MLDRRCVRVSSCAVPLFLCTLPIQVNPGPITPKESDSSTVQALLDVFLGSSDPALLFLSVSSVVNLCTAFTFMKPSLHSRRSY